MGLSIDREKVISGLTMCAGTNVPIVDDMDVCILDCPYRDKSNGCVDKLMFDALTLLKEQEAVEPTVGGDGRIVWWYQCGKCKTLIDTKDKFCRSCGREVKWE